MINKAIDDKQDKLKMDDARVLLSLEKFVTVNWLPVDVYPFHHSEKNSQINK